MVFKCLNAIGAEDSPVIGEAPRLAVCRAYISIGGASEIAMPLRHVKLKESVVNKVLIFSTGAKGGVGKSTVAILMIEALKEAGLSVAAIEGDEKSPSLARKYGNGGLHLAHIDLASVIDDAGQGDFQEVLNELGEQWVVVNTPAAGARMFDKTPKSLARLNYDKRAAWCLSLNAEGNGDGVEDDGIFASIDRGLLSAVGAGNVTVVRSLFQVANRRRGFWFDKAHPLTGLLELSTLDVANLHSLVVEAIHRDGASMSELIERYNNTDPIIGAGLEIFWHAIKASMSSTVLSGAKLKVEGAVRSGGGSLFGPGGLALPLINGTASTADGSTTIKVDSVPVKRSQIDKEV